MEHNKYFASGSNMRIQHPLPIVDTKVYPVIGGEVRVFQYSDDTVLVQIIQPETQPQIWVNREFVVDADTNTANIIPKKY